MSQRVTALTGSMPASKALMDGLERLEQLQLTPDENLTIQTTMVVKEWCDVMDQDIRLMTFEDIIELLQYRATE